MEYIIWGIPPNGTDEVIIFQKPMGALITDIDFAEWCEQQAIKRGCTATRIQAIDLNVAPEFNQLFTNAAQAV